MSAVGTFDLYNILQLRSGIEKGFEVYCGMLMHFLFFFVCVYNLHGET